MLTFEHFHCNSGARCGFFNAKGCCFNHLTKRSTSEWVTFNGRNCYSKVIPLWIQWKKHPRALVCHIESSNHGNGNYLLLLKLKSSKKLEKFEANFWKHINICLNAVDDFLCHLNISLFAHTLFSSTLSLFQPKLGKKANNSAYTY